jgi:hypothetical protein
LSIQSTSRIVWAQLRENVARLKRICGPGGSENLRPSLTYAGPSSESHAKFSFINFVKLNFFLVIGPGENCFRPKLINEMAVTRTRRNFDERFLAKPFFLLGFLTRSFLFYPLETHRWLCSCSLCSLSPDSFLSAFSASRSPSLVSVYRCCYRILPMSTTLDLIDRAKTAMDGDPQFQYRASFSDILTLTTHDIASSGLHQGLSLVCCG